MTRVMALGVGIALSCVAELTLATDTESQDSNDARTAGGLAILPERPAPLLELNEPFLAPSTLSRGWEIPTGAVWRPSLWVFGRYQSALQYFDNGENDQAEWANRLDLFFNLRLTGTERILVGFRPLDRDGRQYAGYTFKPNENEGWAGDFDTDVSVAFFEGDIGEIFPVLSEKGYQAADIGFAIGRQPLNIQNGILINDTLDGIGVTKNTLFLGGLATNFQVTGFYGWGNINDYNQEPIGGTKIYGLFSSWDTYSTTMELDLAYRESDDSHDGYWLGLGSTRRFGHLNTTFRFNYSDATDIPEDNQVDNTQREGYLLSAELSLTPAATNDLAYLNLFHSEKNYVSLARDRGNGGPLASMGILFAGAGIGNYGAALDPTANKTSGFAMGYQWQLAKRRQLTLELGGRYSHLTQEQSAIAVGMRYQQPIGNRTLVQLDMFHSAQKRRDDANGIRVGVQVNF
ncbi:hypothetical protein [Spartinivicinus ruber]|uniref:hypothetical protein n=1 Tax=Spartinivicinus ruber TaxID=2683272 RepID=UPI0013D465A8|nr:hypothetical protein [Spartinivicinus ruber]